MVTLIITDIIPLTSVELSVSVYNIYGSSSVSISNVIAMGYDAPVCGINYPISASSEDGGVECKPPGIQYGVDYTHAVLTYGGPSISTVKPLPVSIYNIYKHRCVSVCVYIFKIR